MNYQEKTADTNNSVPNLTIFPEKKFMSTLPCQEEENKK